MSITKWLLFGFFFCAWTGSLCGQDNILIERFTTENGLPSNGIKGIQWDDSTGLLWIATESGVLRYNGAGFKVFDRTVLPEMVSERMLFLLKDLEGRIYTADENGNIFFVIRNSLQFLGRTIIDTRLSAFKLTGLAASSKMFRQSSLTPTTHIGRNDPVAIDESHMILLQRDSSETSRTHGIFHYDLGQIDPTLITQVRSDARLFTMDGQVFIYQPGIGFFRLIRDAHDSSGLVQVRPDPTITQILHLPEGCQLIWKNGMKRPVLIQGSRAWTLSYQAREDRLIPTLISNSFPKDEGITSVAWDENSGTLFIGTFSTGLIVIRKQAARTIRRNYPTADKENSYYSQLALHNGSILTSEGHIIGGPPLPASQLPIRGAFNNFILHASDSSLWYCQDDTIHNYNYTTRRTSSIYCGHGSITTGFLESGHTLYAANAIGIGIIENGTVNYLYKHPKADMFPNVPFAMAELGQGVLGIACCNGLLRYNTRTRQLDTIFHREGICVRALWKFKGYLFIGTYGKGIWLWKDGVLKQAPSDKNGYLQYAHCFIPDTTGLCWISTNKGLFRADPSEMIDACEKGLPVIYYNYYGRVDGMDITELNGGCTPCALSLNDSTLSFPSMNGLVWVDPGKPILQFPKGNIYIDEFLADGKRVESFALMRPELPSSTMDLSIHLCYPAWVDPENIYIKYKLEPFDKEWKYLRTDLGPVITYSNIGSGNYHLKIVKLNGFGEENFTTYETDFRIALHWYQQPLIWLLGIVCIVAMGIYYFNWQNWRLEIRKKKLEKQVAEKTKELLEKNEELERNDHIKTRLISIISHDIVPPLKFLHLASRNLTEKRDALPQHVQWETIAEVTNTSKELELLATNVLNWIKYRNEDKRLVKEAFNLRQLTELLFGIFRPMVKSDQVKLKNNMDPELMLFQFIEPVKIILYNLILNGINFTSSGSVTVSNTVTREGTNIIIEDTGVGMTDEQIDNILSDSYIISSANVENRKGNGLGYLIIKDLLRIVRARITIKSSKVSGTKVVVLILN